MSFDGVVTRAVTHELMDSLTPGRIMKIYQPTQTELIVTIRSQGKNHSVLLSAHPSYARMHMTKDTYQNPKEPPMFCMLLRKHLVGGFIESIEQLEMERVIQIKVRGKDEIGDERTKTLVMEIMGKHSNIILVDQERGMILDSIKHVSPSQSSYRTVLPGHSYRRPPDQGKTNPITLDPKDFVKKLDFNSGRMDKQIMSILMGFSPMIATEISYRARLGSATTYQETFSRVQSQLIHHDYTPQLLRGKKEHFYVLPLESMEAEKETYNTVSELLDAYYSGKAERDRVKQQAGDLARFMKNERDKNIRKIKKHEETLQKAEKADEYQRQGELLTAHIHLVKQGDKSVTVVDYYDPEQGERTIELNPNKTPSENAQSYFATYSKMKKSKEVVQKEIQKAEEEIAYFDQLIQQIESAREEDVEEIREELREEGYMKAKPQQKKKKKPQAPKPETYFSSDGTTILVGKNNKQNEYVTTRMANRNDYWLHTKDIPGSHVVIRSEDPSEETLQEAALLAAYFSKSKASSSVPVDYTLIRHVKKPNGAKPGFVTYDNQKTLFVTPEEAAIRDLKNNEAKD
ncbi:NFACT family protein [Pontibacillus sp. ALD_SL1]|uniref:Rqc2 family fibronectin-binding protein n=1 Tax=Pontibacillus sp. ALD_SL1 TaxID=2777185 RepID=UPI001A95E04D|nr:NFACT RNA binding domain-containing protein [Pontibacillus sp. ALD_SL1]QST01527.1 NFACT family protein [Pontibacillus sp. ALD_SL1]